MKKKQIHKLIKILMENLDDFDEVLNVMGYIWMVEDCGSDKTLELLCRHKENEWKGGQENEKEI